MDEGKRKEKNWDVRDVTILRWGRQWQWLLPALGELFSREPDSCDPFPSKQALFLKCFNVVHQKLSPLQGGRKREKFDNYTLLSKLKIKRETCPDPYNSWCGKAGDKSTVNVTVSLSFWCCRTLPGTKHSYIIVEPAFGIFISGWS